MRKATASLVCAMLASACFGAPRDVQFKSVDFSTSVIEVHNYGAGAEDLTGFRFCTSSPTQVRVYTTVGGLNGVTLQPGESLFVHLNNDAPMGDPLRRNASSIGNFTGGFAPTAYGLSIYSPPIGFANAASMVDHVMWNIDGVSNTQAATRAGVAVTTRINLLDASGGMLLHGPSDYEVLGAPVDCPGDANGDNTVNFTDLNAVLSTFGQTGPDIQGDLNNDEIVNFTDLNEVLSAFGNTCP
jgi:hypothetical protein